MRPELLAPAGSFDALRAAVEAGADAVYMAGPEFNARRNAKNFTEDELREALLYCRERGVRTHITLNILLTDAELPAALAYAEKLAAFGADALIVADVGVARLLSARLPDMELHASTQMTLCNTEGVRAAADLGFRRAVLSRELSLEDIREITRNGGLETEVFAHGALCMCYSGQCYMSALIGRRSGNRGLCAQPCRLPYRLPGGDTNEYPLSLKDLNLSRHLAALSEAGVSSLKIEGRMKSPAYVSAVTGVYAACLEDMRAVTPEEQQLLADAFSRDGFTDGYFKGRRGPHMFGTRKDDAVRLPDYVYREGHEPPRVNVTLTLSGHVGDPLQLAATDGIHTVALSGDILAPARTALSPDRILDALCSTGGTPYRAKAELTVDPSAHVPLSAVKALRRDVLAKLSAARREVPAPKLGTLPEPLPAAAPQAHGYTVFVEKTEQITESVLSLAPHCIALPLEAFGEDIALPQNVTLAAVMPTVARPGEMEDVRRLAHAAKEKGAKYAYVSNLGMIEPARAAGLILYGDTGLNLFNSSAADTFAELGFSALTASFELPLASIRGLRSPLPLEAVAYGHLPGMICENCILKNGGICGTCGETKLSDRTGAEFPVLKGYGCRSRILNAHVLWLPDRQEELYRAGISRLRLQFTTETPAEVDRTVSAYRQNPGEAPKNFTRGLYFRPLA
ncbi:MAG: U32 family peptidase [Clostridia bacterium]|nr:U32 family peptidase [Clostridia bacterium]